MAKGSFITDEIRRLIAQVHLEHPDWYAKQVKAEVNRLSDGQGPGLSATQKELTKIRHRHQETSGVQEKLWSLGLLSEPGVPDLPADSIPVVLKVLDRRIQRETTLLTVREAKWIARLHYITSDLDKLSLYAQFYAAGEQACEAAGVTFNSAEMDIGIIYKQLPLVFVKWLASTDIAKDSEKKDVGEVLAHNIEVEILGHRLESVELSGKAWFWYVYELLRFSTSPKWITLSKEKQESIILCLQKYVNEHQENYSHPMDIYEEVGIQIKHETKS